MGTHLRVQTRTDIHISTIPLHSFNTIFLKYLQWHLLFLMEVYARAIQSQRVSSNRFSIQGQGTLTCQISLVLAIFGMKNIYISLTAT